MKHVTPRTRKRKTGILKSIEKKTGIPQNVLVIFAVITVVFAVMTLSYDMSSYKAAHALIFAILALPPVLLSFILGTTFWLPTQNVFDVFFWSFAALYWLGLSFGISILYNQIKKSGRNFLISMPFALLIFLVSNAVGGYFFTEYDLLRPLTSIQMLGYAIIVSGTAITGYILGSPDKKEGQSFRHGEAADKHIHKNP